MCSSTLSTDVQLTGQRRGMTCLVCSSLFTFQLCLSIFISLMSLPRILRVFAHSVFSLYLGCFFQRSLVMLGWGEHCLPGYARGVCFTPPFLYKNFTRPLRPYLQHVTTAFFINNLLCLLPVSSLCVGVCFTPPFLCEQLMNSYLRIQIVKL
jgi:hypothetical protein